MSTETILSRMMSEPAFADALFADADKALAEYSLPAEEVAKFKSLTRATFDAMTPDERKSFAIIVHDRSGLNSSNHNETALRLGV